MPFFVLIQPLCLSIIVVTFVDFSQNKISIILNIKFTMKRKN